jgi:hypothetical protein
LEKLAISISNLVVNEYIKNSEDGITNSGELEKCNAIELFWEMFPRKIKFPDVMGEEEFIGNVRHFMETLDILFEINVKMTEYFSSLKIYKQEYFDDPDDPPIPKISKTFYFVECDNYMTVKGLVKFDLDYVIFRTGFNRRYAPFDYTKKL